MGLLMTMIQMEMARGLNGYNESSRYGQWREEADEAMSIDDTDVTINESTMWFDALNGTLYTTCELN